MSIGRLTNEGDLKRFVEKIQPPQPPTPDVSLIKNGVPTDKDFPKTPGDGTLAVDTSGPTLYCRIATVWTAL